MRIEGILAVATVSIVGMLFVFRFDALGVVNNQSVPELIFTNTIYTEVDTNSTLSTATSRYGVQEKERLKLERFIYHSYDLDDLRATVAIFEGDDTIWMEGNVTLKQHDGEIYKTQKAIYHQKTTLLEITVPFEARRFDTVSYGKSMVYNGRTKEMRANTIESYTQLKKITIKE